jgi:enhancing lycopene biosynthesis protein 2
MTSRKVLNSKASGNIPLHITTITNTTQATTTSTGALIVAGGIAIAKSIYGGMSGSFDTVIARGTTSSTSITTGSVIVAGGVGITENLYCGATGIFSGTVDSSSTLTGTLVLGGGMGVAKNLYCGATGIFSGTVDSTSTSTGTLVVGGGMGIAKSLYCGGAVNISDTTASTSTSTGALIVGGGMGVSKNLYCGGDMVITGALSKGSGAFLISHPDPSKSTWKLKHCFCEAPTRGTNFYEYIVSTKDGVALISLPSYFKFLNERPYVYVSAKNVMGYGYGNVDDALETVSIHSNVDGDYFVMITAVRKDELARDFWDGNGGAEIQA